MLAGSEPEEVLRIDEIIAKSRQIVSDSLNLTRRSQDRFNLPFDHKELTVDIVPSCETTVDARINQLFRRTPVHTPRNSSIDIESRGLIGNLSAKANRTFYEDTPELKGDSDRYRLEIRRLRSDLENEASLRGKADATVAYLQARLDEEQSKARQGLCRVGEQVKSLQDKLDDSEHARSDLKAQVARMQEEKGNLLKLLEMKNDEVSQLRVSHNSISSKGQELQHQLNSAQEDIIRLHHDYAVQLKQMQDDYLQQLSFNQELKAKTESKQDLSAKLQMLEDQLHGIKRAEAAENEHLGLRKLHEIEYKLKLTNERYEQLADQLSSRSGTEHQTTLSRPKTKAKAALNMTPKRKRLIKPCKRH